MKVSYSPKHITYTVATHQKCDMPLGYPPFLELTKAYSDSLSINEFILHEVNFLHSNCINFNHDHISNFGTQMNFLIQT